MKGNTALIILVIAIIIGTGIKKYSSHFPKYITDMLEITRLKNKYLGSKIDYDYDLIIVGAGLAGLTSAFEANKLSEGQKKILVLEKMPKFGGNSAKATSGINMLNTPLQEKEGVKDSFDIFYKDTMKSGKNLSQPKLVSTVVNDSHYLYDFFTKEIGSDISKLGLLGGHSVARTHRPTKATIGYHLVETVYNKIKKIKEIKIIFNATVAELLTNEQKTRIIGVKYYLNENTNNLITLSAKAVILASGGFGHDFDSEDSLLKEFVPDKMKFPTTNGKQTQGIGVKIARKIGIGLTDMNQVQIHPTGFVNLNNRYEKHKILAPELLRGVGGILINQKGKRFCNELGTRDYVSQKILENCEMAKSNTITQYESFMLINQKAIDVYGGKVNFYIEKGYLKKYNTFKEFTEKMNISKYYDNLVQTIKEYNESADTKKDKFGKKVFPQKFDLNDYIYAGIITPSIHYCMGGVTMNENGELIKTDGKIMNGLFGAGEVTGGLHGGNRLGGNSLMECGVFGRRTARAAVEYINTFNQ
jgi:flavocytochrome c